MTIAFLLLISLRKFLRVRLDGIQKNQFAIWMLMSSLPIQLLAAGAPVVAKKQAQTLVTSSPTASVSETNSCSRCAELDAVTEKLRDRAKDSIAKAQEKLRTFEFSKAKDVRLQEIQAMVRMGVRAIEADESGESDSYFLNVYQEDETSFETAINSLNRADQKLVRDSIKGTKKIRDKGNG